MVVVAPAHRQQRRSSPGRATERGRADASSASERSRAPPARPRRLHDRRRKSSRPIPPVQRSQVRSVPEGRQLESRRVGRRRSFSQRLARPARNGELRRRYPIGGRPAALEASPSREAIPRAARASSLSPRCRAGPARGTGSGSAPRSLDSFVRPRSGGTVPARRRPRGRPAALDGHHRECAPSEAAGPVVSLALPGWKGGPAPLLEICPTSRHHRSPWPATARGADPAAGLLGPPSKPPPGHPPGTTPTSSRRSGRAVTERPYSRGIDPGATGARPTTSAAGPLARSQPSGRLSLSARLVGWSGAAAGKLPVHPTRPFATARHRARCGSGCRAPRASLEAPPGANRARKEPGPRATRRAGRPPSRAGSVGSSRAIPVEAARDRRFPTAGGSATARFDRWAATRGIVAPLSSNEARGLPRRDDRPPERDRRRAANRLAPAGSATGVGAVRDPLRPARLPGRRPGLRVLAVVSPRSRRAPPRIDGALPGGAGGEEGTRITPSARLVVGPDPRPGGDCRRLVRPPPTPGRTFDETSSPQRIDASRPAPTAPWVGGSLRRIVDPPRGRGHRRPDPSQRRLRIRRPVGRAIDRERDRFGRVPTGSSASHLSLRASLRSPATTSPPSWSPRRARRPGLVSP